MSGWTVPAGFASIAPHDARRTEFVRGLPAAVDRQVGAWSLRLDGETRWGRGAVALPVRTRDDRRAVLRLHRPDEQSEHEHVALRLWNARASVELFRADPARQALLLERLSDRHLDSLPVGEACEVVGGLYADLHVPATGRLRPLTELVARRTDELAGLPRDAAVPHRLVEQAVGLGRELVADPDSTGRVIHTDLHDRNVLAPLPGTDRPRWVVIDPKPLDGDPHYEPAPMLWNRWAEAERAHDLRAHLRSRLFRIIDASGLDEDRAKAWVVVRMMHGALWTLQEAQRGAPLDRRAVTIYIAVAKAVQD